MYTDSLFSRLLPYSCTPRQLVERLVPVPLARDVRLEKLLDSGNPISGRGSRTAQPDFDASMLFSFREYHTGDGIVGTLGRGHVDVEIASDDREDHAEKGMISLRASQRQRLW